MKFGEWVHTGSLQGRVDYITAATAEMKLRMTAKRSWYRFVGLGLSCQKLKTRQNTSPNMRKSHLYLIWWYLNFNLSWQLMY